VNACVKTTEMFICEYGGFFKANYGIMDGDLRRLKEI
jgi:hypothetical protein